VWSSTLQPHLFDNPDLAGPFPEQRLGRTSLSLLQGQSQRSNNLLEFEKSSDCLHHKSLSDPNQPPLLPQQQLKPASALALSHPKSQRNNAARANNLEALVMGNMSRSSIGRKGRRLDDAPPSALNALQGDFISVSPSQRTPRSLSPRKRLPHGNIPIKLDISESQMDRLANS
jgi:hypothetical protein